MTPTDDIRARVRAVVEAVGEVQAARQLQVSRQTLARCLAGLDLQRGSLSIITQHLPKETTDNDR